MPETASDKGHTTNTENDGVSNVMDYSNKVLNP